MINQKGKTSILLILEMLVVEIRSISDLLCRIPLFNKPPGLNLYIFHQKRETSTIVVITVKVNLKNKSWDEENALTASIMQFGF